jgi:hypothetical protein
MSGEPVRRGIDDAGRLHSIAALRKGCRLTVFEAELLESLRLINQRLGEVASAVEAVTGRNRP